MAVLPNFKHLLQILDKLNSNQVVVKSVLVKVNTEQLIANYFSKPDKNAIFILNFFWLKFFLTHNLPIENKNKCKVP